MKLCNKIVYRYYLIYSYFNKVYWLGTYQVLQIMSSWNFYKFMHAVCYRYSLTFIAVIILWLHGFISSTTLYNHVQVSFYYQTTTICQHCLAWIKEIEKDSPFFFLAIHLRRISCNGVRLILVNKGTKGINN